MERQLTVTVAVTAAVHFLSACHTESASSVFGDRSTVPQCLCMHECAFSFVCLSLWMYTERFYVGAYGADLHDCNIVPHTISICFYKYSTCLNMDETISIFCVCLHVCD